MQRLSPYAEEMLGHYVYALRSPLDKQIFYVGKGVGSRVLDHANGVLRDLDSPDSMKVQVIRSILAAGLRVECFIVQHGLASDDHAFQTESALFGILKLLDSSPGHGLFTLTNLIQPPTFEEFGLMSTEDVLAKYGEPADGSLIPHNSVFIKPSQLWRKGMSNHELWSSTRGWWPMAFARIKKIKYVFAVPNLVIRAVWEVSPDDWREQRSGDHGWSDILERRSRGLEKKPRYGFDSMNDVSESKFSSLINKSVAHTYLDGQGKRPSVVYLDDTRIKALAKGGNPRQPFWNVDLT